MSNKKTGPVATAPHNSSTATGILPRRVRVSSSARLEVFALRALMIAKRQNIGLVDSDTAAHELADAFSVYEGSANDGR